MKKTKEEMHINSTVTCACGNIFETKSNKPEIHLEVCSNCHPTYTGKNVLQSKTGKAEKFKQKYGLKDK